MTKANHSRRLTLTDVLVTLSAAAILLTMGLPAIDHQLHRLKVLKALEEGRVLLATARHEAVRSGVPVVTFANEEGDEIIAFLNVDDDRAFAFDPAPTGDGTQPDYAVASWKLPEGLELGGASTGALSDRQTTNGLTASSSGPRLVFLPDGSVRDTGAFRVRDDEDNSFELRLESKSVATIGVLKYHPKPSWGAPPGYFTRDQMERATNKGWQWN